MSEDSLDVIAKVAAVAAGAGSAARVAFAAHGGARGWRLGLEAVVGAALGVIAAAGAVWFDPGLKADAWAIFITSGAAGLAGAMGTRGLDLLTEWLSRKGAGK
jgi:hypothetical protein